MNQRILYVDDWYTTKATAVDIGTVVSIAAQEYPYISFTEWYCVGVTLEHPESSVISFVMPDADVALYPNYEGGRAIEAEYYSGTDAVYDYKYLLSSETFTATAGSAIGSRFVSWYSDDVTLEHPESSTLSIDFDEQLPSYIYISAAYGTNTHNATINGSVTSAPYNYGVRCSVPETSGELGFSMWSLQGPQCSTGRDSIFNFIMPDNDVTAVAVYGPKATEVYAESWHSYAGSDIWDGPNSLSAYVSTAMVTYNRCSYDTFVHTGYGTWFPYSGYLDVYCGYKYLMSTTVSDCEATGGVQESAALVQQGSDDKVLLKGGKVQLRSGSVLFDSTCCGSTTASGYCEYRRDSFVVELPHIEYTVAWCMATALCLAESGGSPCLSPVSSELIQAIDWPAWSSSADCAFVSLSPVDVRTMVSYMDNLSAGPFSTHYKDMAGSDYFSSAMLRERMAILCATYPLVAVESGYAYPARMDSYAPRLSGAVLQRIHGSSGMCGWLEHYQSGLNDAWMLAGTGAGVSTNVTGVYKPYTTYNGNNVYSNASGMYMFTYYDDNYYRYLCIDDSEPSPESGIELGDCIAYGALAGSSVLAWCPREFASAHSAVHTHFDDAVLYATTSLATSNEKCAFDYCRPLGTNPGSEYASYAYYVRDYAYSGSGSVSHTAFGSFGSTCFGTYTLEASMAGSYADHATICIARECSICSSTLGSVPVFITPAATGSFSSQLAGCPGFEYRAYMITDMPVVQVNSAYKDWAMSHIGTEPARLSVSVSMYEQLCKCQCRLYEAKWWSECAGSTRMDYPVSFNELTDTELVSQAAVVESCMQPGVRWVLRNLYPGAKIGGWRCPYSYLHEDGEPVLYGPEDPRAFMRTYSSEIRYASYATVYSGALDGHWYAARCIAYDNFLSWYSAGGTDIIYPSEFDFPHTLTLDADTSICGNYMMAGGVKSNSYAGWKVLQDDVFSCSAYPAVGWSYFDGCITAANVDGYGLRLIQSWSGKSLSGLGGATGYVSYTAHDGGYGAYDTEISGCPGFGYYDVALGAAPDNTSVLAGYAVDDAGVSQLLYRDTVYEKNTACLLLSALSSNIIDETGKARSWSSTGLWPSSKQVLVSASGGALFGGMSWRHIVVQEPRCVCSDALWTYISSRDRSQLLRDYALEPLSVYVSRGNVDHAINELIDDVRLTRRATHTCLAQGQVRLSRTEIQTCNDYTGSVISRSCCTSARLQWRDNELVYAEGTMTTYESDNVSGISHWFGRLDPDSVTMSNFGIVDDASLLTGTKAVAPAPAAYPYVLTATPVGHSYPMHAYIQYTSGGYTKQEGISANMVESGNITDARAMPQEAFATWHGQYPAYLVTVYEHASPNSFEGQYSMYASHMYSWEGTSVYAGGMSTIITSVLHDYSWFCTENVHISNWRESVVED